MTVSEWLEANVQTTATVAGRAIAFWASSVPSCRDLPVIFVSSGLFEPEFFDDYRSVNPIPVPDLCDNCFTPVFELLSNGFGQLASHSLSLMFFGDTDNIKIRGDFFRRERHILSNFRIGDRNHFPSSTHISCRKSNNISVPFSHKSSVPRDSASSIQQCDWIGIASRHSRSPEGKTAVNVALSYRAIMFIHSYTPVSSFPLCWCEYHTGC